ncbi:MAG: acyl-CoA dehydrogenase family protein, partial [Frankiaceae bacterium]
MGDRHPAEWRSPGRRPDTRHGDSHARGRMETRTPFGAAGRSRRRRPGGSTVRRTLFTPDHDAFRRLCHDFLSKEAAPYAERWEKQGIVDRHIWPAAGAHGL